MNLKILIINNGKKKSRLVYMDITYVVKFLVATWLKKGDNFKHIFRFISNCAKPKFI